MKSLFFTSMIFLASFVCPTYLFAQGVLLTCGDECIEDEPVERTTEVDIRDIIPLEQPDPCMITITWNEAEVCPLEGGGCVFEIVSIEYSDDCAYDPEDVVYYGLIGFLIGRVNDGCVELGPDGCATNVRLYSGQCMKRVYTNGNWKIFPCYESLSSPCCKSVYKICLTGNQWQITRTGFYSPTPECFSFGLRWNQVGSQCYPVCEMLPEDWTQQIPS